MLRPKPAIALTVFWLAGVVGGMALLADYSHRAAVPGAPPRYVPELRLSDEAGPRYTILMFAHPHCPCTAASINELARLMARSTGVARAEVCFYRPENEPDSWTDGRLWSAASQIPGVTCQVDPHGERAARFQVRASGSVLVYDASGTLRFHGGITSARGHEGDNAGADAVFAIVHGKPGEENCPVFGCSLGG